MASVMFSFVMSVKSGESTSQIFSDKTNTNISTLDAQVSQKPGSSMSSRTSAIRWVTRETRPTASLRSAFTNISAVSISKLGNAMQDMVVSKMPRESNTFARQEVSGKSIICIRTLHHAMNMLMNQEFT